MKYYFIAYECDSKTRYAKGNITLECNQYPGHKEVKQAIFDFMEAKETFSLEEIIVTSIYRMNEEEFYAWQSNKE